MTANLMAHHWYDRHVEIIVVESPDIGIIGVGEGSTPQLRDFFSKLDIAESEWMPRCNATYKNGISFYGWTERPGFEHYFHPFPTVLDSHTAPSFYFHTRAKRTGRDVHVHPDSFFLSAALAKKRLGPKPSVNFPFDVAYGYHFDAHLVGAFLREHATKNLNVIHFQHTVSNVRCNAAGEIVSLVTSDHHLIEGDFFVDSSGFRSTLLQQVLEEPFISFKDNLFNDSAVAIPTACDPVSIPCETQASALTNGWSWKIPLTNRTGNGYVYASDFISDDAAEIELRTHLDLLESDVPVRRLKMKVGHVARSWVKNCLAVGLAQGFIEPLEATALHIVQTTVEMFITAFEDGDFSNSKASNFNETIVARFNGIRDYIVCHYRMNGRADTEYWQANAANKNSSDSLKSIMSCWFTGGDLVAEIEAQNIGQYYTPLSWHCLLAGYGVFPDDDKLYAPEAGLNIANMQKINKFIDSCALNFTPHGDMLAYLKTFNYENEKC